MYPHWVIIIWQESHWIESRGRQELDVGKACSFSSVQVSSSVDLLGS